MNKPFQKFYSPNNSPFLGELANKMTFSLKQKTCNHLICRFFVFLDIKISGAGGKEVEPLEKVHDDFDIFYFYLKELLDVVDDMERSAKKEN